MFNWTWKGLESTRKDDDHLSSHNLWENKYTRWALDVSMYPCSILLVNLDSFNQKKGFHTLSKRSWFRKFSRSCSHSNSELFGRLFDEVISEGRQLKHSCEDREIVKCWHSSQLQNTHGAQRPSCLLGVEHLCTQKRKCFLSERHRYISLLSDSRERPFHVMFVRTHMNFESQYARKITSALADSSIYLFTKNDACKWSS